MIPKISNEELLRNIEARFMGEKMQASPEYKKIYTFYEDILRQAPKGRWAYDEAFESKLRLVINEISQAEKKLVCFYLTHGAYEQLKDAIQILEQDFSAQANSLEGGDVSWGCYDRENWLNSLTFVNKIATILGIKIVDNLNKEEAEDEENYDDEE